MILQKLNAYYERLEADESQDIATFGFSPQAISFGVILELDGTLHSIEDLRDPGTKGPVPRHLIVPYPGGRSSNIKPYFLWDKTAYVFGRDIKEEAKGKENRRRLQKLFKAFHELHLSMEPHIQSKQFSAVCRFLEHWKPSEIESFPQWKELSGKNVVFRIRGQTQYIHDLVDAREAWINSLADASNCPLVYCLVTNKTAPPKDIHSPIKGVYDPNPRGQAEKAIVTFNQKAFESYGKKKGQNAPICKQAAFQYITALNLLLADERRHVQIGDATTVFWTEKPSVAEMLIPALFGGTAIVSTENEDTETLDTIRSFLNCLRQGKPDELAEQFDPQTPFYILGLAPTNSPRINIRYWLASTIGELCTHLSHHVRDLDIAGLDDHPPTISELLLETAALQDPSKIPKNLTGELLGAILTGRAYPLAFYMAILRRIRAEGFANHKKHKDRRRAMSIRAAIVKACLIRNFGKEISMALQTDRPEAAYHLGRWFAAMEITQRETPSGKTIKATIKDKFYRAASATPSTVFPRVIPLSDHHMKRIEKPWRQIGLQKLIQGIAWKIDDFPRHLKLEDQGLFHLGYYHQTQAFYTKKNDSETPNNESE